MKKEAQENGGTVFFVLLKYVPPEFRKPEKECHPEPVEGSLTIIRSRKTLP